MWKTVLFLIATLLAIPVLTFYFDESPSEIQTAIIWKVTLTYLVLAGLCFVVSLLTNNHSQVDKLWSIAPILYAWQIAYFTDFEPRMVFMAGLITLWGVRLTYNFSRRGGYSWKFWTGDEDYRWAVLRAKPEFQAPWKWFLFNLFFISLYQMGLVMLIVFPMIKSSGAGDLTWIDYLLGTLVLGLIVFETIADQQQWNFQNEKYRRINAGEDLGAYRHGFVRSGLWGICRHPNYFAEQSIWIVIYLFSAFATGIAVNWSIAGCVLLCLLFYGSSKFSEEITEKKYPEYKEYQRKTKRFIPGIY